MIPLILGAIGVGAILGWLIVTLFNVRPRRKKKIPSLTKFVVFSLGMVILYTIIAIVYQWIQGSELSPTLTTCFFSCLGGEVLSASLIKIFKLKEEDHGDTNI